MLCARTLFRRKKPVAELNVVFPRAFYRTTIKPASPQLSA
jgi:hypothetical protein